MTTSINSSISQLHILEVIEVTKPKTWLIDRSKIQNGLKIATNFSILEINILIRKVLNAIKDKDEIIKTDIFEDLINSDILKYVDLELVSKNLPASELLKLKVEIAKAQILENDEICSRIKELNIDPSSVEELNALIEIFKFFISHSQTINIYDYVFIQNSGLDRYKSTLMEIAKWAAEHHPRVLIATVNRWGFDYKSRQVQTDMIELAKVCAVKEGQFFCQKIENFNINYETSEGQIALIDIIKLAFGQNDVSLSSGITTDFSLMNDQNLIELAKKFAKFAGAFVSKHIQKFNINRNSKDGQEALIEIAKIAMRSSRGFVSDLIVNFGINSDTFEGHTGLIEIAKIAASFDENNLSRHIKKFNIDGSSNYGQQELIEIAKIASRTKNCGMYSDTSGFSYYIKNYGINSNTFLGQQGLIEIAKNAALHDFYLPSCIEDYEIEHRNAYGQNELIKIAKLSAQNVYRISEHIHRFRINHKTLEGQFALYEIAKIAANSMGGVTSTFIQNYNINSKTLVGQKYLIDILKIAVNCKTWVPSCIVYYELLNSNRAVQKVLIEIAKISAKRDGEGSSHYISDFKINYESIDDQIALIEIAKIAAKDSGDFISHNLKKYHIDFTTEFGQRALLEIAKITIPNSYNIKYYPFNSNKDERTAIITELYKLFMLKNSAKIREHLEHFPQNIMDTQVKIEIYFFGRLLLLRAIANSIEKNEQPILKQFYLEMRDRFEKEGWDCEELLKFDPMIKLLTSPSNENLIKLCNNAWRTNSSKIPTISSCITNLLQHLDFIKPDRMPILEFNRIKTINSMWLVSTLGILAMENISSDDMYTHILPILVSLSALKDPQLRELLTNLLISEFLNQKPDLIFPRYTQRAINISKLQELNPKNISILLGFLFVLLEQQGLQLPGLFNYIQNLKGSSNTPLLKDAHFSKQLLKFLNSLINEFEINANDKENLIKIIFDIRIIPHSSEEKKKEKDRILALLSTTRGIIDLNAVEKMKIDQVNSTEDLISIFLSEFSKIVPIKPGIENVASRLEELFNQFRDPKLIQIYAACLKGGNEIQALLALTQGIEDILEAKFPLSRYEDSIHLTKIFALRPDLVELWQKNDQKKVSDFLEKYPFYKPKEILSEKENFHKFLHNSFMQGHVDTNIYPFLVNYLNQPDPIKQNEIWQNLSLEIKISAGGITSKDENKLQLQLLLIKLVDRDHHENPLMLLNKVTLLLPSPDERNYQLQFDHDIKSLIQSIEQIKIMGNQKFEGWQIVDTDNFVDLFTCGTEVEGSCQDVRGLPNKNKCLMGYVLDGKNRLLAIKDANGKIQARSILRLLINEKTKEPVLFLERIYPQIHLPEIEHFIVTEAKLRARALHLPLLSVEVGRGPIYPSAIVSESCGAPYEYVDALEEEHVTNGLYKITKSNQLVY